MGFRGYTLDLYRDLKDIVRKYDLGVEVVARPTRYLIKEYLEQHAKPIPGTRFEVNRGLWPSVVWPGYRSEEIILFLCSTITREGDSDFAKTVYDGEEFAKHLLPKTPKIILHFRSEFRDAECSYLPYIQFIINDFSNRVYHLPYDLSNEKTTKASIDAMENLVKELLENDMQITFEVYKDILKSAIV